MLILSNFNLKNMFRTIIYLYLVCSNLINSVFLLFHIMAVRDSLIEGIKTNDLIFFLFFFFSLLYIFLSFLIIKQTIQRKKISIKLIFFSIIIFCIIVFVPIYVIYTSPFFNSNGNDWID